METVKQCPIHKIRAVWKEGTSKKTGKKYAFWSCPDMSDGFCQAELVDVEESSAAPINPVETRESVDRTPNPMIACNAMNNTISLVIAEKIDLADLAESYKRILDIFENSTGE